MVLTVSSVQLLVLGILDEYLGRLYMQSKQQYEQLLANARSAQ